MTAESREELGDARFRAVLDRLQARGRFGIRLGLGRTRAILRYLGDPHEQLRGVLVGGTNGKGSTQALAAAALTRAGYRVGQTPKPHLVSYRERITIDGWQISVDDFCALLDDALLAADAVAGRHGQATEFEVLTAAAFAHFARSGVDVGVIEVGLGGRLDATNAWQGGVSAITNVALDHTEHLGPTVEKIAREKSHIIKRGDSTALTGAGGAALAVIRRRAARVGVPLHVVEPLPVLGMDLSGVRAALPGGRGEVSIGLLGRHQAANGAVAWAILDALAEAGIAAVSDDDRRAAFAAARWPGRMEIISLPGQPDVLLDGAHNPHGVEALARALPELLPRLGLGAATVLCGVLANHWQPGMLEPLIAELPGAALIATRVPGTNNSLEPARLAAAWGAGSATIGDAGRALDAALGIASRVGGPLVICGSLYLVGYLRTRLLGERAPA